MKTLLLASSNLGKLKEFQEILGSNQYTLIPQDSKNIISPEETGFTFVENALIKSRAACRASGLPAIADDSGLVVPALNGEPGIYSARYAGNKATDKDNREKLCQAIQEVSHSDRHAYFHCTIVLLRSENDPVPIIAEANWHGIILDTPRGKNGFGYDSLFYIPSLDCTAAELSSEEKNKISHRGLALEKFQKKNL